MGENGYEIWDISGTWPRLVWKAGLLRHTPFSGKDNWRFLADDTIGVISRSEKSSTFVRWDPVQNKTIDSWSVRSDRDLPYTWGEFDVSDNLLVTSEGEVWRRESGDVRQLMSGLNASAIYVTGDKAVVMFVGRKDVSLFDASSLAFRSVLVYSNYRTVAMSPDRTRFAIAERVEGNRYRIEIYDSVTGRLVKSFHSESIELDEIWFSGDGREICAIGSTFQGEWRFARFDAIGDLPARRIVMDLNDENDSLAQRVPQTQSSFPRRRPFNCSTPKPAQSGHSLHLKTVGPGSGYYLAGS